MATTRTSSPSGHAMRRGWYASDSGGTVPPLLHASRPKEKSAPEVVMAYVLYRPAATTVTFSTASKPPTATARPLRHPKLEKHGSAPCDRWHDLCQQGQVVDRRQRSMRTGCGTVVAPLPSWPWSFKPQVKTRPPAAATLWYRPVATDVTVNPSRSPCTRAGPLPGPECPSCPASGTGAVP